MVLVDFFQSNRCATFEGVVKSCVNDVLVLVGHSRDDRDDTAPRWSVDILYCAILCYIVYFSLSPSLCVSVSVSVFVFVLLRLL
jgi:hypothetical protein